MPKKSLMAFVLMLLHGVNAFSQELLQVDSLAQAVDTLKASVVSADVPIMRVVNDTIIYNAAAANVLEGDSSLDMLRQMPGVEVKDDNISVYGKKVARTYVNGNMVFGSIPTAAFKAIPTKEVTLIKSYDELSVEDRRRGRTRGDREQVLDIRTRSEIERAVDAHAILSGGFSSGNSSTGVPAMRYHGGVTANYFSEMLQASVTHSAMTSGESPMTLPKFPGHQGRSQAMTAFRPCPRWSISIGRTG